jgi:hypothetical protein
LVVEAKQCIAARVLAINRLVFLKWPAQSIVFIAHKGDARHQTTLPSPMAWKIRSANSARWMETSPVQSPFHHPLI